MRRLVYLVMAFGCGHDQAAPDAAASPDGASDAAIDGAPGSMLGTVTTTNGTCSPGMLPSTSCQVVTVQCPGVPEASAEVRVTPAQGTRKGTVVFGTGGGGTTFYDSDQTAATMLRALATEGYQVVQRRWTATGGWLDGPGGMLALSCRYATLVTWVYTDLASASEAFCATGNSGGSTEVAYALAHWGRGDILDLAMPTGGPPMGRMDHGCLDGTDATWLAQCHAEVPPGASTCVGGPSCAYSTTAQGLIDLAYTPATPCANHDETERATLLADSVGSPTAALAYPHTVVRFLYGADDCTEAVTLGLAFASTVTTTHSVAFVANTPHPVFSTAEGARAIHDAIIADCVPR